MKKFIEMIEKANGKRRLRIVTLDEIKNEVEKQVRLYKGKKKHIKYLTITNTFEMPMSYGNAAYYTKWVVTLTAKGTIKTLEAFEARASVGGYTGEYTHTLVTSKDINKITGVEFSSTTVIKNVNKVLENAILKGEI